MRIKIIRFVDIQKRHNTNLTPIEKEIYGILLKHKNEVVTRDYLIKSCWKDTYCTYENLKVHIHKLKKKVPHKIYSVRNTGYRLEIN